ncbi:MAG: (2Fe-2S)-binding protein [Proteobacteria bacterium]|nr:(2Fe-2S)-binding protein [Pseudomonadota bacterium]
MYVCLCHGITDRQIRDAVTAGCSTLDDLGARTGAGTGCGGCTQVAEAILHETLARHATTRALPLPMFARAA